MDSSQSGQSPPSPLRTFFLPQIVLAGFTALHLGPKWRFAGFVALTSWMIKEIRTLPGGSEFDAYFVGCGMGGVCLLAFMELVAVDAAQEWSYKPDPQPIGEMSYLKRFWYLLCAAHSPRGIDWACQVS